MSSWDERFMFLAQQIGGWSKDRSREVGCVIIGPYNEIRSTGYNGFPRNVNDNFDERHERPSKYKWTEHAERNAIYNAARVGVSLDGCKMYVSWFPCMDCARAIVQSGITHVVCIEPNQTDRQWGEDFRMVPILFKEAGIKVKYWNNVDIECHTPR